MSDLSKEDVPPLSGRRSAPQVDAFNPHPHLESKEDRQKLEKTLLRKVDIRMSILIFIFILSYIDRNNTAAARLRGFEDDLGLKGAQFATVLSIFYVAYLLMQIPSNMFLNRIGKPSVYLPCCVICWGVVSLSTGFVTNYSGAIITRVFLGFLEAAFYPGASFLITKWYKLDELARRLAILSCGGFASMAFGSLIASGILDRMDGVRGFSGWRWLYIIEGSLTVFIAVLAIFILPDFPESKTIHWLTPAEHALARRRMIEDADKEYYPTPGEPDGGGNSIVGAKAGFVMAVKDWKVWYFAFASHLTSIALSFFIYFPTLVSTMGFNPTITLVLCAPPWLVGTVVFLWFSWHSDRTRERCMHTIISYAVGIVGFILAMATMNTAVRYISFFFMAQSFASLTFIFVWGTSTVSNPTSKRAVALAIINSVSQSGNIVGSYIWPKSWGPTYNKSYGICMAAFSVCIIMCLWMRRKLRQLNEKMDLADEQSLEGIGSSENKWRYLI